MKPRSQFMIFLVGLLFMAFLLIGLQSRTLFRIQAERQLADQLRGLRAVVRTYMVLHKSYPADLETVMTDRVQEIALAGDVLALPHDAQGHYLDPFGQPYRYDPHTGWVSAGNEKYQDW